MHSLINILFIINTFILIPFIGFSQCADVIVAQDGSADFTSVQAAIEAAPDESIIPFVIYVKNGVYDEKLFIEKNFITLIGEDRDSTIISTAILRRIWRENNSSDWGVATINIQQGVTDLTLANMTIRNNFADLNPHIPNNTDHTMAIRGGGHRVIIVNCNVIATGGDTLSLWNTDGGMFYHNNCFFEGYVDYVAPRGYCYITDCEFFGHNNNASIWHDGSGGQDHKLVITNSYFDGVQDFALGRYHREAAFYLKDCHLSERVRDQEIRFVGPEPINWGHRVYYSNVHREGGDYGWHTDNFSTINISPDSITPAWTFNREWDPESQLGGLLPFAFLPKPENKQQNVSINPALSWVPANCVESHLIYFGPISSPPFLQNQIENTFEPGELEYDKTYYWRVDEIINGDTIEGEVWTFTTSLSLAAVPDPIPEPIEPSGIEVVLEDYLTIPRTSGNIPKARINMLKQVDDGSGQKRLFVNDLRGILHSITNDRIEPYLAIIGQFPNFIHQPGKGTGFGGFAFHPEFAQNGKFYTTHAEETGSGIADFSPEVYENIALQWVLLEWTANDPQAGKFSGAHREILRFDFPHFIHGLQDISFNPTAKPGDPDYGLLYICIGEGGSSILFFEENIQKPSSYLGTIFRIDPKGTNGINGQYGIPAQNLFETDGNPETLGEIWAYGFRNPHRISWDKEGDHKILIGDIGEKNIEEVNLGKEGANYGWGVREGTFVYDRDKGRELVYELPEDDIAYGFVYPVSMYDHDEGLAVIGGYVYRGTNVPALYGQYLCGDIVSGRVFLVPVDELEQGIIVPLKELSFVDENGQQVTLQSLTNNERVDLRFGYDMNGEIYILSKADGVIRKLKSINPTILDIKFETPFVQLMPNPGHDIYQLKYHTPISTPLKMEIYDLSGKLLIHKEILPHQRQLDLRTLSAGVYEIRWKGDGKMGWQKVIKK